MARDLSARGHRVVGLDLAPTLLAAAKGAAPEGEYLIADAAKLPFRASSFDVVVAYNSLMDIEEMCGAVNEVGRVLRPGGTFCISVTHPVNDVGRFVDPSTYVVQESYLDSHRFEGSATRDGSTMTFFGWTHPLQDYTDALKGAGLQVTDLREPRPDGPDGRYEAWRRLPMFLQIRAVKPGA